MNSTVKYEYKDHLIEKQAKTEQAMLLEFENGNFTMENPLIKYNPYYLNALSAVMLFETPKETAICIRVLGKDKKNDIYHAFPRAKKHIIPIVGLYEDYENKIEVYPWQKYDKKVVHTIKTPKVCTDNMVEYMKTTPEYLQDNMIMLNAAVAELGIGVDSAGDIRLQYTEPVVWDTKRLDNGNIIIGSERLVKMPYFVSGIYELSPVGKIYKEYRVPRGFHHDQILLPNGDICALSCNWNNGTVEDQCVVIDKDSGVVKKTINFLDFIKPGSGKSGSWSDEDWFHCNAVWYDEYSNSLTFSGRHIDAMVNIDFDTCELNWIIGDPEGWPEDKQKYFFKPKGDNFEWQYEQHANMVTPLGDVMCFDNHHWGSKNKETYLSAKDSYSRGVKYRIDTDDMTIEQVWQYGKERGAEYFSPYICNVEYYNEGHYMSHSGGIAFDSQGNPSEDLGPFAKLEDPDAKLHSITVEVCNDKVELELKANSNYYRAEKMPLYALKGNNLAMGKGQVLGTLGITPEMDYDIPAEYNSEMLPEVHEAKVVDEADMFTVYSKYEKGQLVMVLLEKGEESHKYFVSTSAGHRGAMCTGTFLSSDARDTRICISKEGFDGEYDLRIIVDEKKYDTGIKIKC